MHNKNSESNENPWEQWTELKTSFWSRPEDIGNPNIFQPFQGENDSIFSDNLHGEFSNP